MRRCCVNCSTWMSIAVAILVDGADTERKAFPAIIEGDITLEPVENSRQEQNNWFPAWIKDCLKSAVGNDEMGPVVWRGRQPYRTPRPTSLSVTEINNATTGNAPSAIGVTGAENGTGTTADREPGEKSSDPVTSVASEQAKEESTPPVKQPVAGDLIEGNNPPLSTRAPVKDEDVKDGVETYDDAVASAVGKALAVPAPIVCQDIVNKIVQYINNATAEDILNSQATIKTDIKELDNVAETGIEKNADAVQLEPSVLDANARPEQSTDALSQSAVQSVPFTEVSAVAVAEMPPASTNIDSSKSNKSDDLTEFDLKTVGNELQEESAEANNTTVESMNTDSSYANAVKSLETVSLTEHPEFTQETATGDLVQQPAQETLSGEDAESSESKQQTSEVQMQADISEMVSPAEEETYSTEVASATSVAVDAESKPENAESSSDSERLQDHDNETLAEKALHAKDSSGDIGGLGEDNKTLEIEGAPPDDSKISAGEMNGLTEDKLHIADVSTVDSNIGESSRTVIDVLDAFNVSIDQSVTHPPSNETVYGVDDKPLSEETQQVLATQAEIVEMPVVVHTEEITPETGPSTNISTTTAETSKPENLETLSTVVDEETDSMPDDINTTDSHLESQTDRDVNLEAHDSSVDRNTTADFGNSDTSDMTDILAESHNESTQNGQNVVENRDTTEIVKDEMHADQSGLIETETTVEPRYTDSSYANVIESLETTGLITEHPEPEEERESESLTIAASGIVEAESPTTTTRGYAAIIDPQNTHELYSVLGGILENDTGLQAPTSNNTDETSTTTQLENTQKHSGNVERGASYTENDEKGADPRSEDISLQTLEVARQRDVIETPRLETDRPEVVNAAHVNASLTTENTEVTQPSDENQVKADDLEIETQARKPEVTELAAVQNGVTEGTTPTDLTSALQQVQETIYEKPLQAQTTFEPVSTETKTHVTNADLGLQNDVTEANLVVSESTTAINSVTGKQTSAPVIREHTDTIKIVETRRPIGLATTRPIAWLSELHAARRHGKAAGDEPQKRVEDSRLNGTASKATHPGGISKPVTTRPGANKAPNKTEVINLVAGEEKKPKNNTNLKKTDSIGFHQTYAGALLNRSPSKNASTITKNNAPIVKKHQLATTTAVGGKVKIGDILKSGGNSTKRKRSQLEKRNEANLKRQTAVQLETETTNGKMAADTAAGSVKATAASRAVAKLRKPATQQGMAGVGEFKSLSDNPVNSMRNGSEKLLIKKDSRQQKLRSGNVTKNDDSVLQQLETSKKVGRPTKIGHSSPPNSGKARRVEKSTKMRKIPRSTKQMFDSVSK